MLHKHLLPYPLRWRYGCAGRDANILVGQNHFLRPDKLLATRQEFRRNPTLEHETVPLLRCRMLH